MMATVRKASKPSRKTMISAGSMVGPGSRQSVERQSISSGSDSWTTGDSGRRKDSYRSFPELGRLGNHLHAVGSVGRLALAAASGADPAGLGGVGGRGVHL